MTKWQIGVGSTGRISGFTRGAITLYGQIESNDWGYEWRHIAFTKNGTIRCVSIWSYGVSMKIYYTAKEREYGGRVARQHGVKREHRFIVEQEELQAMLEGFLHEYVQTRMDARLTRGQA